MEKVNRAQAFQNQDKTQSYMLAKKTLELNPHHSAMKEMLQKLKDSSDNELDKQTEDLASLLYNMALINSGFSIDEPQSFTSTLQKMINVGFGLDRNEPIEEIEVEIDEEEEEPTTTKEGTEPDEEEIVIDGDKMTHTSSLDNDKDVFDDKDDSADTHDDL